MLGVRSGSAPCDIGLATVAPKQTTCEGRVTEMDLPDSPPSLWLALYGDYQPAPPLAGDISVDVAVIGGGYLGMATAVTLRRRSQPPSVAVLEAKTVGYGASGRNGSFAMTVIGLGFGTTAMVRGKRFLRRAHAYMEQCVDRLDDFIDEAELDCAKIRPGFLRVATTPAYVKRLQKQVGLMSSLGFGGIEWIDADATREMVNSGRYLGVMWEPRLLLMDPARLVREEKRHAISLRADVYENSPALAVTKMPGTAGSYRLLTPHGSVTAAKLVYATNAYSHLFGELGRLQAPAFTYMIATQPLTDQQLAPIGCAGQQGLEDARAARLMAHGRRNARLPAWVAGGARQPSRSVCCHATGERPSSAARRQGGAGNRVGYIR